MFTKITHINHVGEIKESVINTDYLISIKELHQDPINLYNSEGEIVETKEPTERLFDVIMKGGLHYKVNETEYNKLVKALIK